MKKIVFEGCATAMVTPMCEDGSVNLDGVKSMVEKQITGGVDALVICATTGESATLNYKEHLEVIDAAVKQAGGRVPIIASAGSNDTVYSVGLCNDALKLGADAILSVTPYYNKTSQAGLIRHYNYIADRVDAPIIVYNVPSRTGVNILPSTYKEISKHPNIVATKEANGNLSSVLETISLCGDDLTVYSGNDDQIVPIMSLGGRGVISVASNLLPKEMHDLTKLCLNGDFKAAAREAIKYCGLMKALFMDINPIPIKDALRLAGMDAGHCRLPLIDLNEEQLKKLKFEMEKLNII